MAKRLLLIMVLVPAIFLLGCATSGRKYDTGAINAIVVGQTTQSQVISLVGEPVSITRCSNGIDIYHYSYAEARPFGLGTSVDSLELQLYRGIVRDKRQALSEY